MPQLNDYRVLREHEGDRFYREGETRTAEEAEVAHLVPNVLELLGPAKGEKAKPAPANKAAKPKANKSQG